jgi:membrane protein DedA with SNARE-associated domain
VAVSGLVLLPLFPNGAHLIGLSMIASLPRLSLPIAVLISAIISLAIVFLSYRIALRSAKEFLVEVQV